MRGGNAAKKCTRGTLNAFRWVGMHARVVERCRAPAQAAEKHCASHAAAVQAAATQVSSLLPRLTCVSSRGLRASNHRSMLTVWSMLKSYSMSPLQLWAMPGCSYGDARMMGSMLFSFDHPQPWNYASGFEGKQASMCTAVGNQVLGA